MPQISARHLESSSANMGTRSVVERLTNSIHANKKGEEWYKYLDKLLKSPSNPSRDTKIKEALNRINVQLKADSSIMKSIDPKLEKLLNHVVRSAILIVAPRDLRCRVD